MLVIVIISIVIALLFSFLNGMNDAANSIATIVNTRVLSPTQAVIWAAMWNFAALLLFGLNVANTMGKGIVDPIYVNEFLILSALLGSVIWVWFCTRTGMPISVSHALIGGLIGPVWFAYGAKGLVLAGILKVVAFIVIAPLLGFVMGFAIMAIVMRLLHKRNAPTVDRHFRVIQLFSSAAFSLGHGGNDAQKVIGIISILLFSVAADNPFIAKIYGSATEFRNPMWIVLLCYTVISVGTILGGRKVIRTLGDGLTKMHPVQGFCAETAGALTLIGSSILGIPVSTTHTITGSIIGVGATKGLSSVKWATASNIVGAWVFTIPATIIISGLIYLLMTVLLPVPAYIG